MRDKVICHSCHGTARRDANGEYRCESCAAIIRGPGWSIEVSGHDASEVEKVASGLLNKAASSGQSMQQVEGGTDMDIGTATSVITAATAAVNLFDKVADQVVRFIRKGSAPPGPPKQHQFKVDGAGGELKVESHG